LRSARNRQRSDTWQKLKLENQQEFVSGGFRPGSNGIDALLVGYYDATGLRFAGKVRAGFVPHLRREVFKALKPLHTDDVPSSICRTRSHPAGAAA
jgi:ATP-dependent DNA ligase